MSDCFKVIPFVLYNSVNIYECILMWFAFENFEYTYINDLLFESNMIPNIFSF